MLAENLQHVRQQRDSRTKQNEPDNIQRLGISLAVVRQVYINHQQTDQANRNVHEKNESPVQVTDDQPTGNGSQHGTDQSWNSYKAHGSNELGLRKRSNQREPSHRHHHRSAATLQD